MGEEIAFENGQISEFQRFVTLTLDRVILLTGMHHSSTSTYIPKFIEMEETFFGRTTTSAECLHYNWVGLQIALQLVCPFSELYAAVSESTLCYIVY